MADWRHISTASPLPADVGTGTRRPYRVFVDGKLRLLIDPETGAFVYGLVTTEPVEPGALPAFFFRESGGKQQLCVKFDTGVTQILATEP